MSAATANVSGYTEQDLKEHLKLTCSIIIDDVADHWDSYERKFRQAQVNERNNQINEASKSSKQKEDSDKNTLQSRNELHRVKKMHMQSYNSKSQGMNILS